MSSSYNRRVLTKVTITDPDDEIVISGISGRFPNSANVADFAYNLYNKVDMVDDDERRWHHTNSEIPKRSGKVNGLEKFDASFFSVHHRQANLMDPQCRMLLEHSYEAIVDAGINPATLRESRTGVFMGCCFSESEETMFYARMVKDGLGLTGSSRAMLANRVSFALGLRGPSFMLDTACSSSMYALDCAFSAIRSGECDAALVGGTNLLLHPYVTLQFARLGVLSKDGFCRPFDKNAAGYSRAEAVSVIFLQKKADAKRIYADVIYSKTNNDGFKKESITYPSGFIQIQLLKEFYDDLKMDPSKVDFVEAHSTGTVVGDPEECHTLDTIFCKGRNGRPLPVGSVKSNMGHSEATSGVCSIAKVIIAFENKLIPPNINFVEGRPGISALDEGRLRVVTEPEKLEGPYICVNSFGFGGGNAHSLLRGNEKEKTNHGIPEDGLPRLAIWSGRTEEAVRVILDSVTKKQLDAEYIALLHSIQITSNSANTYRGYGIYSQNGSLENANCVGQHIQHFDGVKRPIVWVYSGMGSQWSGMGADLMKIPIFAESIEKCHNLLLPKGLNLKEIITSTDPKMFDSILHSFVGIAAIQIGLTDILKSLGLVPDHIIGHSVGELGCAYADGCLTAEEMILSSYSRGMVSIETKVVFGSMAAVGVGYKKLRAMVPEGIEIACHNSADSCTISGPAEKVATFVDELKKQNYFAKEVQCSNIPYHSGYIAEMGPKLLSRLNEVIKHPTKRSQKWISSSVPKVKWDTLEAQYSSAQYHTSNLLSSVLFEEACELLPKEALTIEIAPHGLLQAILKGSIPDAVNIPLTKRADKENLNFFFNAIGRIYENGVDIDASKLYPPVQFPVSRGTPMISPLIKWDHSEDRFVTKYTKTVKSDRVYSINISDQDYEYVTGHTIDGRVLFPATGYLYLVWLAVADINHMSIDRCDIQFEDVKFLRATALTKNQEIDLNVVFQRGSMKFEINEGSNPIVTGSVKVLNLTDNLSPLEAPENRDGAPFLLNRDFYKELRLRGYHYNGLFRSVVSARADGHVAKIKWSSNWTAFLDCLLQLYIIGKDTRALLLPTGFRKVIIKPQEHQQFIDSIQDEEKILDVFTSNNSNFLRCGGVEMRGLQASLVSRRRPPGVPVLETYQFIPHISGSALSKINVVRFCVQLALENIPTSKVMSVEIDANDEKEPLSDYFGQALGDLPLITGDINYLTSKELDLEKVLVQDCSLSSFSNINFIIKSEVLNDTQFLTDAALQLAEGGFVVSREKIVNEKLFSNSLPDGFQIVAVIPSEEEFIVLVQYFKVKPTVATKVVKVSSENYDWIEELKQEVQKGQVIAYSEKEKFSGIIGLVNCIRKEPNGLNLKCVFIDDNRAPAFDTENPFYRSQLEQGLAINVFRNGRWGSYKHLLLKQENETIARTDHCYANSLLRGDLSSMTWLQGPYNYAKPKLGVVTVQYSSLNFRDVMLATGKLTAEVFGSGRLDQLCILGLEFSGLYENKKVMGMVKSGALATHIEVDKSLVWDCPDDWTLEQAATIPVVYGTVYSAFFLTAKIEKGKSILIHAGSGGVGLAAIRVAFAYGLEVFTTVSTEEKKQFLLSEFPQLKEKNIGNSRDISFEDLVMMRTEGKGVDYVLNSLADEKLQASVRCLGKGGKFLEIGKFDMANDSKIGLGHFMREICFHAVLLDKLFFTNDEEKKILYDLITDGLKRGIIQPLKSTVYRAQDIEQAFRYLASGKHIGKVLLKIRENESDAATLPITVMPRVYCSPDYSYIIPGGLGGFGLELADWLVLRGCRKLVLSSSRGITKQYQAYRIKTWESYGVQVTVNTSDISTKAGCEQLIRDSMKLGPVGGIFNLAVILKDSIFDNQDVEKFVECMAPKAVATKHLDELTRKLCPELQYFVVFSSVSCGRGNAGQSNYGMANSVMERIIEQRHLAGLPAKAIQWGAVGEVGLVADMQEDKVDMEIGGTLQQRISSCLEELDSLMTVNDPVVSSMVVAEKRYSSGGKRNILESIMNIMAIRDIKLVSMETTLSELGMDSLMTVEIQQTLEREYDLAIAPQELRSMTLSQLVKFANSKDSSNTSKIKIVSQNVPTGVAMLLRNLGDETNSDQTILQLKSFSEESKVKALIVPGIEGMAGQSWYRVAESLKCQAYVLQCKSTWLACELDNIYEGVIQDVLDLYKNDDKFFIIGYSFGALLSLQLAKTLESKGKTGKIILLDGSPKFLNALAKDHMPENSTDETIQTLVLANTINILFNEDKDEKMKAVLSESSWETRANKLIEFSREKKVYSDEYGWTLLNSLVNRLKLTLALDLSKFSPLDKTPFTLVRPSEFSILEIEEDYGLSSLTSTKVNIKYVEGNHTTILDNPKLYEILNNSVTSF